MKLTSPNWDDPSASLFRHRRGDRSASVSTYGKRAIEKCSKVVDKHTLVPSRRDRKYFKRPEFNKWIDDNYTVIGKAYYMKEDYAMAEDIFLYLARTVDTNDAQAWAYSWLAESTLSKVSSSRRRTCLQRQKTTATLLKTWAYTRATCIHSTTFPKRTEAAARTLEGRD